MNKINLKKFVNGALIPTKKHYWDAGFDLSSVEHVELRPGELATISTGIGVELPQGYVGIIKERSSMALVGFVVQGGVIDSSYRGEIKILASNLGPEPITVEPTQRIAQLLILKVFESGLEPFEVVEEFSTDGQRGNRGFGSTGKWG